MVALTVATVLVCCPTAAEARTTRRTRKNSRNCKKKKKPAGNATQVRGGASRSCTNGGQGLRRRQEKPPSPQVGPGQEYPIHPHRSASPATCDSWHGEDHQRRTILKNCPGQRQDRPGSARSATVAQRRQKTVRSQGEKLALEEQIKKLDALIKKRSHPRQIEIGLDPKSIKENQNAVTQATKELASSWPRTTATRSRAARRIRIKASPTTRASPRDPRVAARLAE